MGGSECVLLYSNGGHVASIVQRNSGMKLRRGMRNADSLNFIQISLVQSNSFNTQILIQIKIFRKQIASQK